MKSRSNWKVAAGCWSRTRKTWTRNNAPNLRAYTKAHPNWRSAINWKYSFVRSLKRSLTLKKPEPHCYVGSSRWKTGFCRAQEHLLPRVLESGQPQRYPAGCNGITCRTQNEANQNCHRLIQPQHPAHPGKIGLSDYFDAVTDGNNITRSKPDPEVFLLAAQRLGITPSACLVVDDADAGIESALAAGMSVLGVGSASNHPRVTITAQNLMSVTTDVFLEIG